MMAQTDDRSPGRGDDPRRTARDEQRYSRRIDCAERPRMDAARPGRGAGAPADDRWGRTGSGTR